MATLPLAIRRQYMAFVWVNQYTAPTQCPMPLNITQERRVDFIKGKVKMRCRGRRKDVKRPRAPANSERDDDDVYYYIGERLKLEGETENMGVWTKERKGVAAEVLMATPCTNSLGGESEGHKHEGCGGRRLCWKFAAVSWSGAGGRRC